MKIQITVLIIFFVFATTCFLSCKPSVEPSLENVAPVTVGSKVSPNPIAEAKMRFIKNGTSFGFCRKDCREEIKIENTKLDFVLSSNDKETLPDKTTQGNVTENEWQGILKLVNKKSLENLPTVIGHPDGGDGGAEWVEVYFDNGETKRVAYDYMQPPEQLKLLAEKLRRIRAVYSKKMRKD